MKSHLLGVNCTFTEPKLAEACLHSCCVLYVCHKCWSVHVRCVTALLRQLGRTETSLSINHEIRLSDFSDVFDWYHQTPVVDLFFSFFLLICCENCVLYCSHIKYVGSCFWSSLRAGRWASVCVLFWEWWQMSLSRQDVVVVISVFNSRASSCVFLLHVFFY